MERLSAFSFRVEKLDAGKRFDVYLSENIADLSRSYAAQLVKDNYFLVNGLSKKPGHQLKYLDSIKGTIPEKQPSVYLPEPIELSILFEDGDIIVVDKPPGLVVHPAPGHLSGTLVNGILHHCPDLGGIGGEIRPGIVHRLDKDTSGVLVVAKNAFSLLDLSRQFKSRTVKKEYIALVLGELCTDSGIIDLPIARHPVNRKKMATQGPRARAAETRWRVFQRFMGVSLVKIELKTGRTHQIRVHFSASGHPVVGDPVYGGRNAIHQLHHNIRNILTPVCRQMLHAYRLTITHPTTKKAMSFESPIPMDMAYIVYELNRLSVS